jgi:hypothetical protein
LEIKPKRVMAALCAAITLFGFEQKVPKSPTIKAALEALPLLLGILF